MANTVRGRAELDDRMSGPLDKIRSRFDTLGKSKGFKAVAQGVGLGFGVSAWGALQAGISAATDFIGDSVRAFAEEEQSVAKLNAALTANVKGWDGNTDAIERVLTARMELGFSDDEQRDSLALLTAATGDATKALDLQRTAMDLARLKSISLGEASEALVKVEAGSFRVLKSLGIELRKGATQTEALAAVQAVATGQAEAYADTLAGKATVAQIKFNEAQERFGEQLAPTVADGLTALARAMDGYVVLSDGAAKSGVDLGGVLLSIVNPSLAATQRTMDQLEASTGATAEETTELAREQGRLAGAIKKANPQRKQLLDQLELTEGAVKKVRDQIDLTSDAISEKLYGQRSRAGGIAGAKLDVAEAKNALRDAEKEFAKDPRWSWTKKLNIEELKGRVADAEARLFDLNTEAAKMGDKPASNALLSFLDNVYRKTDVADTEVQRLINHLRTLASVTSKTPLNKLPFSAGRGVGRAAGGPVSAGQAYVVGERGPELFMPSRSGTIVPNGGGTTVNVTFQALAVPSPAQQQAIARALVPELTRELRRAGSI